MAKNAKRLWLIIVIVAVVILLPIAWYLASPLFIDKIVNEEMPQEIEQDQEGTSETTTLYSGAFSGADSFHQVEGQAHVITANGREYLRFEDFQSTNGPDLKVYLSKDLDAKEYISLGDLKGNIGNQNYELQEEIDFEEYKYALIWCERFRVLFGKAELMEFF